MGIYLLLIKLVNAIDSRFDTKKVTKMKKYSTYLNELDLLLSRSFISLIYKN